jgi:hypothetical protein
MPLKTILLCLSFQRAMVQSGRYGILLLAEKPIG